MVEVGGRPILWHIMKNLSAQGVQEFIVATGYKSNVIKDYFLNYEAWNNDFTLTLGVSNSLAFHGSHDEANWKVTVAYTGEGTMTGGRVFSAARYLDDEPFLVTYGDGLADVDLARLVETHQDHGRLVTVTTVQPTSRFGILDLDSEGRVKSFSEKPVLDGWVNIGFFVMQPAALDYLNPEGALEEEPMTRLVRDGQLAAYRHFGFWQPMDTFRESSLLNKLWDSGTAPWRIWDE